MGSEGRSSWSQSKVRGRQENWTLKELSNCSCAAGQSKDTVRDCNSYSELPLGERGQLEIDFGDN